jgi:SulP family sulfate permease
MLMERFLPCLGWLKVYDGEAARSDALAAAIVTIMLIPQSLAYALLAGLPPEVGLYASMLPLLGYALFGSSNALAVGPVAVVSLMTAAALGQITQAGTADYATAALVLALLSGLVLIAMGLLRLGFLANLLSHPVISGFITASGVLIAASQMRHVLGIEGGGHTLIDILASLAAGIGEVNLPTLIVGTAATAFLFWVRKSLKPLLRRLGLGPKLADTVTKAGPVAAVLTTILLTEYLALDAAGVAVVGAIPQGLPPLTVPVFDAGLWWELAPAAILISVVGFVESVSVAQTLAAKKRQRIQPNRELIGLGAANVSAAVSGGYPVTGGFARSVVNFDAGARTPLAGVMTAVGIGLTALLLTPLFHQLPKATLAATIIVAVLSLIDLGTIKRTWAYSKTDFAAMAATILLTLGLGVEAGIMAGVGLSLVLFLVRAARPHIAVVGQVPGTEHFRNVLRHTVVTSPTVFSVRVDESLYFANARWLEDTLYDRAVADPKIKHVVLICAAVNQIDASALESLESLTHRLADAGVTFHLSEVKGPVMDALKRSDFLDHLTGQVFLTQYQAMTALDPDSVKAAYSTAQSQGGVSSSA